MSSGDLSDRDRGRRKKKKNSKPKEQETVLAVPKAPIILTKPVSDKVRASSAETTLRLASKPLPSVHPQLADQYQQQSFSRPRILKSRDDFRMSSGSAPGPSISPSTPTPITVFTRDLEETSGLQMAAPKIQIQQKSVQTSSSSLERPSQPELSLDARLAPYPEMKTCVKLVDESLHWCENALEYLQDQTEFIVLGVLGLQGVGKSTVMSALASSKFCESGRLPPFKVQTNDQQDIGEHCTKGIDIYVTSQRIILLDVQPVLSASVMDHMLQHEKKYPSEFTSIQNALEIQSLQIAAFLFTVCHAVVVVQDWFTDPNFLCFIQTAEMLRPPALLATGDSEQNEITEYCPHLVFVCNKCQHVDFSPANLKNMQDTYKRIFHKAKFKVRGTLGISGCGLIPSISPETMESENINLFLLPYHLFSDKGSSFSELPSYQGHPGFQSLVNALRRQISAMPRSQVTHTSRSEKNWFHYAARTWETVKKFNQFIEYSRLLP